MPDTPIDQSSGIQSIRLKVPTGTVPVPPAGFGQLHTPSPGVLALRLPDGSVVEVGPPSSGSGSGIAYVDVQLTDAQVKALPSSYPTLLAAPGAGLEYVFHNAYLLADCAAGAYTNHINSPAGDTDALYIAYGDDDVWASAFAATSLLGAATVKRAALPPFTYTSGTQNAAPQLSHTNYVNKALKLVALNSLGGNFTGGHANNTLSVRVWYSTVPALPFGA